jgi:HEAT repeat protein
VSSYEPAFSLASFLCELALAWQKLALYQEGHPAQQQAVDRAHAALVRLIAPTGGLALGVSREAIIGPEEKLAFAAAARLAGALYLCEVAVLRFEEGIEPEELAHLLRLLPRSDRNQTDEPLADELAARGVSHIHVQPVDFSGLVATESLEDPDSSSFEEPLWDRMLQQLLNDRRFATDDPALEDAHAGSLADVLPVINSLLERYGATADREPEAGTSMTPAEALAGLARLVGGAIKAEVLEASDPEAQRSVVRHFTELLGALPDELQEQVLDAALRELGTVDEAAPAVGSLGGTVSAARLVGSLRRLRSERAVLSPRILSLVESLAVDAKPTVRQGDDAADSDELARELRQVFIDGESDPTMCSPGLDDRLFVELQRHTPIHARFADLDPYLVTLTEQRLSVSAAMTLIDLLQKPAFDAEQTVWVVDRLQTVFRELLIEGRFLTAVRVVESLRAAASSPGRTHALREAAEGCLETFREADTLAVLVDAFRVAEPPAVGPVRQLIQLLGPPTLDRLLVALGEEPDLSRRRHVFDLLVALGPLVVPAALALVSDSRWYTCRNMFALLRHVEEGLSLDVLRCGLEHPEPRVRFEAIKCLPQATDEISRELVRRLTNDPDPKVAESAVSMLGSARVATATEPLVELLSRPDPFALQKELRVRALHALAELGDPSVLPRIGNSFRSWFAVVSAEEVHAAYETLQRYPEPARRHWVRKGQRAPDPAVREICRRMANSSGAW